VIVLDTTVLVYATGSEHPLREPCRRIVDGISQGRINGTTTVEAIQEFVHVRSRRRSRPEAAELGAAYADLLTPLLPVSVADLHTGLRLFSAGERLGAFDAVLAAAALGAQADALVSADTAFRDVPGLRYVFPDAAAVDQLLAD
jgi:predicted nucleic acid-binding protein